MVRTYLADITPLMTEEIYEKYYRRLPGWRQEKTDRYRQAEDRAQSAGAWSLWEMVRRMWDVPETAVYNLSHSGKYVLCAYSDCCGFDMRSDETEEMTERNVQVGCDLEEVKEFRESVARRFFCPGEYEHIMSKIEPERTLLFYRYWVLKESFMKATRQGMALDMRSFEIGWRSGPASSYRKFPSDDSLADTMDIIEADMPVLLSQPEEFPERYYYKEYVKVGANTRIAVCTTDPEIDGELHEILL